MYLIWHHMVYYGMTLGKLDFAGGDDGNEE